jgi:hypothetical protein
MLGEATFDSSFIDEEAAMVVRKYKRARSLQPG